MIWANSHHTKLYLISSILKTQNWWCRSSLRQQHWWQDNNTVSAGRTDLGRGWEGWRIPQLRVEKIAKHTQQNKRWHAYFIMHSFLNEPNSWFMYAWVSVSSWAASVVSWHDLFWKTTRCTLNRCVKGWADSFRMRK